MEAEIRRIMYLDQPRETVSQQIGGTWWYAPIIPVMRKA
jgi:hypothetical protein